jgi:hypothetical protein
VVIESALPSYKQEVGVKLQTAKKLSPEPESLCYRAVSGETTAADHSTWKRKSSATGHPLRTRGKEVELGLK